MMKRPKAVSKHQGTLRSRRQRLVADSPGQAIIEMAIALPLMVIMFAVVVSAGQFIGYASGLTNAAATGAAASVSAVNQSGNATTAAVTAVNQEQGTSSWTKCDAHNDPPCVEVTSASQSTGSSTSITVEKVTLHGTFAPLLNLLGTSFTISTTASAST